MEQLLLQRDCCIIFLFLRSGGTNVPRHKVQYFAMYKVGSPLQIFPTFAISSGWLPELFFLVLINKSCSEVI